MTFTCVTRVVKGHLRCRTFEARYVPSAAREAAERCADPRTLLVQKAKVLWRASRAVERIRTMRCQSLTALRL